jgi:hypothetical protein
MLHRADRDAVRFVLDNLYAAVEGRLRTLRE